MWRWRAWEPGAGSREPGHRGSRNRLQDPARRLEIVARADGIGRYADWLRLAREHHIEEGLIVVVAAPEDILRSKQAAGREKDRAALAQMRRDFVEAGALERSPKPEPGGSFG